MSAQSVTMQPPTKPKERGPRKAVGKEVVIVLTIVLVYLIIMLAIALATYYSCCGPPGPIVVIKVTLQEVDGNWSLIVDHTSSGLALNNVTLTIYNAGGFVISPMNRVPLSMLTEENWTTYGVLYKRVANETEVNVEAAILINMVRYPIGSHWEFSDSVGCLSAGTFK